MAPSSTAAMFLAVLVCMVAASLKLPLVHGQLDSPDFITIDCGIADGRTYHAEKAGGLVYVSDAGFTDAGLKAMVRPPYDDKDKPGMAERYRTVRCFPKIIC